MKGSCRVCFFVTDYYLLNFIKSLERKSRSIIGLLRLKVSRRDQKLPEQFDKFLRLSENKTDLMKFLIIDWSTNTIHAKILEDKELYVTVEDKAFCISSNGNKPSMVLCSMLSSEQGEADTKLCLCAQFAFDTGFERVNIVTVDTDILEMYFQSILNGKIYLQYGTSSATTLYETV